MIDATGVWGFLWATEDMEDDHSSKRLEIDLIKSWTKVNPTADFGCQSLHQS